MNKNVHLYIEHRSCSHASELTSSLGSDGFLLFHTSSSMNACPQQTIVSYCIGKSSTEPVFPQAECHILPRISSRSRSSITASPVVSFFLLIHAFSSVWVWVWDPTSGKIFKRYYYYCTVLYVKVVEIRISAMLVSVCHPKESKFLVYTGSPSRLACTAPTLFRTA